MKLLNKAAVHIGASMKALPKRKGNSPPRRSIQHRRHSLNESPSQKEGKSRLRGFDRLVPPASMKAPPERKGNPREYRCQGAARRRLNESPSKKGREMRMVWASTSASAQGLNESPSEKEGKSALAREGMLGESDPQ